MSSILTWDKNSSPFREKELAKEAEESMKWGNKPVPRV